MTCMLMESGKQCEDCGEPNVDCFERINDALDKRTDELLLIHKEEPDICQCSECRNRRLRK